MMQAATTSAPGNALFMGQLLSAARQAQRTAGFCPLCVSQPRQFAHQDGVTYKVCPKCGDAQEVEVASK